MDISDVHPMPPRPTSADTATISMPARQRSAKVNVRSVSDGTLAGSVLELAQTLTKNNALLRERTEERARLQKILGDFRTHLKWQAQRTAQLKRNLERLHNETRWLTTKATEVKQDAHVIGHELRQATGELDKIKTARDARKLELATLEQEVKLERDAANAVGQLVTQANKALQAHSKERDAWKAEADQTSLEARKLKDRLEEMAYKINGMAAGAQLT
jgi:chromosome segregation ATPase